MTRTNGSDGEISCMVRTQPLSDNEKVPNNAIEWEDYIPCMETIYFKNGETE